jgi:ATP-dependent helicase/nuclease subunit A
VEWEKHSEEETKYLLAEETRLLYVAATRARNLLVVSTYPGRPELSPWHPLERVKEAGLYFTHLDRWVVLQTNT